MKDLIRDIIQSLEGFADARRIEFAKKSYPTQMKVIGVTVPHLKLVLKELRAITKSFTPEEKLHLSHQLIDQDIFECQQLAWEFLGKDKKVLNILTEKDIDLMAQNLDNWISVDYYAALIVGYAWRENKITTLKIKEYLISDDFWIRRIAVVATVALNQKARGGYGDSKRTLEICSMVVDDHHDMINKALSWALRELAKVDKKPVLEFIEKNKARLHKRVLREVTNKLSLGTKN